MTLDLPVDGVGWDHTACAGKVPSDGERDDQVEGPGVPEGWVRHGEFGGHDVATEVDAEVGEESLVLVDEGGCVVVEVGDGCDLLSGDVGLGEGVDAAAEVGGGVADDGDLPLEGLGEAGAAGAALVGDPGRAAVSGEEAGGHGGEPVPRVLGDDLCGPGDEGWFTHAGVEDVGDGDEDFAGGGVGVVAAVVGVGGVAGGGHRGSPAVVWSRVSMWWSARRRARASSHARIRSVGLIRLHPIA